MANLTAEIDSVAVDIDKGSFIVEKRIEERSTASFIVTDITGAATYSRGMLVEIFDTDLSSIFVGYIDKASRKRQGATGSILKHGITCIDNHYLADKRLVVKAYTSKTLEYIVEDIMTDYLVAEGVSEGSIQTGPTIAEAIFNYVKVSDAFDALKELSGFTWYIDADKKLYFINRSTYLATWDLDSSTYRPIKGSVTIDDGNPLYRNRQYIKGGTGVTSQQVGTFTGDAVALAFTVGYPINSVPTVAVVDRAAQTVGIKGVDTGKDAYWSKGDATIVFTVAPENAKAVTITYYGQYPLIIRADNNTAVLATAAIDGTSGIVEDVITEAYHETSDSMTESARGKLAVYCKNTERFKYRTTDKGLEPGQIQKITYSPFNLSSYEMLIESVTISAYGGNIEYSVVCLTGPVNGSWVKFFSNILSRQEKSIKIGDSLLLVLLVENNTVLLTESTEILTDDFSDGLTNRWLNSAPIDAGSLCNVEHELLEVTESTALVEHLTEDYDWGDADALYGFTTWA